MSVKGSMSVVIRCDCAGGCTVLGMDYYPDLWGDGSQNDWFAEFYRSAGRGSRWYRAKKAWQVLRGNENAALDDLVISLEDAERLRAFLTESLDHFYDQQALGGDGNQEPASSRDAGDTEKEVRG